MLLQRPEGLAEHPKRSSLTKLHDPAATSAGDAWSWAAHAGMTLRMAWL
jgi:hypothetical protein